MLITRDELVRLRKIAGHDAFAAGIKALTNAKSDWKHLSIDSKIVHDHLLATIYHHNGSNGASTKKDYDKPFPVPGITVESQVQSTLIKSTNALHVCSRCIKNGVPDEDARDIVVHNRYRRGDEPMISSMRCSRCGYNWVNTNWSTFSVLHSYSFHFVIVGCVRHTLYPWTTPIRRKMPLTVYKIVWRKSP